MSTCIECFSVKLRDFTEVAKTVKTDGTPKPKSVKTPQVVMPLTIKKILENDIKPTKSEYNDLKDLDSRMHALKFSNDIARKFNGYKQGDSKPVTFNRYIKK